MAAKRHARLELRAAAYEAAAPAHSRMENEISLYRNEDYTGESWIKRFKQSVTRSDFRGGGYVVHTTYHNCMTISKKYPGTQVSNKRFNDKELMDGNIRSDEMQMTGEKVPMPDTSTLPQALTGDGEQLKAIQTALSTLEVPQSLRAKHHHEDPYENFAQLQKWADPNLPDPADNSYNQQYTIGDLKKLFGAT